jgi:hypothetical protein
LYGYLSEGKLHPTLYGSWIVLGKQKFFWESKAFSSLSSPQQRFKTVTDQIDALFAAFVSPVRAVTKVELIMVLSTYGHLPYGLKG